MSTLSVLVVVLAGAGVATPFVVLWLRHRALSTPVRAEREPTEDERRVLRGRGRLSVAAFVLFWLVSAALVSAAWWLHAPEAVHLAVFAAIVLMAAGGAALQFNTRCPICRYRLGYQSRLGVPSRCERCGARL